MENSILVTIPLDEFEQIQKKWIREVLKEVSPQDNTQHSKKETYGTRKEVAKELKISLPTLNEFTKKGIIKAYRIGGRVLYSWDEIYKSLQEIKSLKYRRD